MTTYGTGYVMGDTTTRTSDLTVGTVVRLFTGLDDTATITGLERDVRQGGSYVYTVSLSNGLTIETFAEGPWQLPTGGPRQPIN